MCLILELVYTIKFQYFTVGIRDYFWEHEGVRRLNVCLGFLLFRRNSEQWWLQTTISLVTSERSRTISLLPIMLEMWVCDKAQQEFFDLARSQRLN